MIKRILLGIGGTPFTSVAMRRAIELAVNHDAQITAVTVTDEKRLRNVGPVPVGGTAAAKDLREHRIAVAKEKIEEAIGALETQAVHNKVPLTVFREEGSPFELFRQHSRYHDMMIFGLRSMFEYDIFNDNDVDPAKVLNELATSGVTPLVAVSEKFREIKRVLFAYDGSIQAASSMKQFIRLGLWADVKARIVTCKKTEEEFWPLAESALDYCLAHKIDTEVAHRQDNAKTAILDEAAKWDADMIVLGVGGKGRLSYAIFCSTALHILRNIDRPLFFSR
jgi:nucleotide-binding universal stress UspA family protein